MVATFATTAADVRITIRTMIAAFRADHFTIGAVQAVSTDIATVSAHFTAVRTNPCALLTPSTATTGVLTVITGS